MMPVLSHSRERGHILVATTLSLTSLLGALANFHYSMISPGFSGTRKDISITRTVEN